MYIYHTYHVTRAKTFFAKFAPRLLIKGRKLRILQIVEHNV